MTLTPSGSGRPVSRAHTSPRSSTFTSPIRAWVIWPSWIRSPTSAWPSGAAGGNLAKAHLDHRRVADERGQGEAPGRVAPGGGSHLLPDRARGHGPPPPGGRAAAP